MTLEELLSFSFFIDCFYSFIFNRGHVTDLLRYVLLKPHTKKVQCHALNCQVSFGPKNCTLGTTALLQVEIPPLPICRIDTFPAFYLVLSTSLSTELILQLHVWQSIPHCKFFPYNYPCKNCMEIRKKKS